MIFPNSSRTERYLSWLDQQRLEHLSQELLHLAHPFPFKSVSQCFEMQFCSLSIADFSSTAFIFMVLSPCYLFGLLPELLLHHRTCPVFHSFYICFHTSFLVIFTLFTLYYLFYLFPSHSPAVCSKLGPQQNALLLQVLAAY